MSLGAIMDFQADPIRSSLKKKSIRGIVAVTSAQGFKFAIQMAVTAILARLLTPVDFGVIAMAATFTGFAAIFKDAGLSMATVQRVSINEAQLNALFWINTALGCVLLGVTVAMAPFLAWFYSDSRLIAVSICLG